MDLILFLPILCIHTCTPTHTHRYSLKLLNT